MKKITQVIFLMLIVLLSFDKASAQYIFKLDALHSESVSLYPIIPKDKDGIVKLEKEALKLPNGTLVTINGGEDSLRTHVLNATIGKRYWEDMMTVTYEGEKYYVSTEDLVLSVDDNPADTKDFVNKKKNQHTFLGHWYNSAAPYLTIFLLLIAAILFAFFMRGHEGLRMICVAAVPALLLLVVIIEVMGILSVGTNMLWWLDPKRYGWGTSLFRFILFIAAVIMQVSCMNIYMRGLVGIRGNEEDVNTPKLNFKRPIYAALGGAVAAIVLVFISGISHWNSNVVDWLALIIFVAVTGMGIYSVTKQNMEVIGTKPGILFSIFAVIYAVGLVVAFILLIIGFIQAFLEMLINIICCVILFFFLNKVIPIRTYISGDKIVEVFEK